MAATITTEVSSASARLTLGVCCVGHTFSHIFQPVFYVTALVLESELGLTHGGVIGLIVAANVLYGVAAPVAGWLGDRWSTTGMLLLFFTGTGAGMMLTGFAVTPLQIAVCLTLTGLFASIFHPVGFSWLVRSSLNRGTALGIVGVFGGLGPSVAALTAGVLVDTMSWRAAFIIPGAVVIMIGVAFSVLLARGMVVDRKEDLSPDPPASRGDRVRHDPGAVGDGDLHRHHLSFHPGRHSQGFLGAHRRSRQQRLAWPVGPGGGDIFCGWRHPGFVGLPFRQVFAEGSVRTDLHLPGTVPGPCRQPRRPGADGGGRHHGLRKCCRVPPENSLIARYTPPHWRGVAYGLKFVFMFGVGGVGVMMEGALYDFTGGFYWLFVVLAAMAAVAFVAAIGLPGETNKAAAD